MLPDSTLATSHVLDPAIAVCATDPVLASTTAPVSISAVVHVVTSAALPDSTSATLPVVICATSPVAISAVVHVATSTALPDSTSATSPVVTCAVLSSSLLVSEF